MKANYRPKQRSQPQDFKKKMISKVKSKLTKRWGQRTRKEEFNSEIGMG